MSQDVVQLPADSSGSIGIRLDTKGSYTREMFSKGQVVTSDFNFGMKHTCYSFGATVAVFNHPTTIKNGYQTVVHSGTIRQAAKFFIEGDKVLRTGSKEDIKIRFVARPEFLLPNTMMVFRDGRCKGLGKILSITPFHEEKKEDRTDITRKKRIRNRAIVGENPIASASGTAPPFIKKNEPAVEI